MDLGMRVRVSRLNRLGGVEDIWRINTDLCRGRLSSRCHCHFELADGVGVQAKSQGFLKGIYILLFDYNLGDHFP